MSIMGNVVGLPGPQPDWNQADPGRADYIRNKPDLSGWEAGLQQAMAQASGALPRGGGAMEGPVDMAGFGFTGLPDPEQALDAVSLDYLQRWGAGLVFAGQLTLPASGWSGSAPYTQSVSMAGICAADNPHYAAVYSGTLTERMAQKEAFAMVDDLETAEGSLTFTCFEKKPGLDLTVQIEANRKGAAAAAGAVMMMSLEEGAETDIQMEIDGTGYGAANATVNSEPTQKTYDFTVA